MDITSQHLIDVDNGESKIDKLNIRVARKRSVILSESLNALHVITPKSVKNGQNLNLGV